ncbi:MAG: type II toxin-antitoxin system RelE/ParE family toxin [Massilia sp.]
MITSIRHKGLRKFFSGADRRGIPPEHAVRIERMLDRLDASAKPQDMDLPGYKFHPLKGDRKGSYAVSVSGNLRITFRFEAEDATDVDLEDYH